MLTFFPFHCLCLNYKINQMMETKINLTEGQKLVQKTLNEFKGHRRDWWPDIILF